MQGKSIVEFSDTLKLIPLSYSHQQREIKKIDEIHDGNPQDDIFLYFRNSENIKAQ
jgi:hypothetical protein